MNLDRDLQRWIDRAKRVAKLGAREERECIEAWRTRRDAKAAARLIEANLRHVVFTALQYANYRVPMEDLMSEGNVGLMKALQRFDPSRNVRFATYAAYWIRAEIVMSVLDSWTLLSGPRCALDSRVFFRLRRERARLVAQRNASPVRAEDPSLEALLAEQFGVSEQRMQEMLGQLDGTGVSLDGAAGDAECALLEELRLEAEQGLQLERREQLQELERILERVRSELDSREAFILERRLMADPEERLSLGEIGEHFGVSRERVRQIELRAQQKLRDHALRATFDDRSRAA